MELNNTSKHASSKGAHSINTSSAGKKRKSSGKHHVSSEEYYSHENNPHYHRKRVRRHSRRRVQRRRKRIILGIVCGVAGVFVISALICGIQVMSIQNNIKGVGKQVSAVQGDVAEGNYNSALQTVENLANMTKDINNTLYQPQWYVMNIVPVIGHDINVARVYTNALNTCANDALVPLTKSLSTSNIDSLIKNDTINIQSVQTLLDVVAQAAPVLNNATQDLEKVDDFIVPELQEKIGSYKTTLLAMNSGFQMAASFSPIAADILGANGKRTYFIVAENTAEIRANGGFPGSAGTLTLDNGKFSLGTFDAIYNVIKSGETPNGITITQQEIKLFSDAMNKARDSGYDTDFVRTGEILTASYRDSKNVTPNGVIAVAPSMVQRILAIVGGITLSDGTKMNGSNATKVLMHDLYWKYCTKDVKEYSYSDLLFSEAANLSFKKLMDNLNASTLLKIGIAMCEGFYQHEMMVYFDNKTEEQAAQTANLAGSLPNDEKRPQLGVFFNMYTPSKMGWWLDMDTDVSSVKENEDGSKEYNVKTVISNTLTEQEAAKGTNYITQEDGNMNPRLYLYAPAGGTISDVKCEQGLKFNTDVHNGINMFYVDTFDMKYGESFEVTYTVKTSSKATEALEVLQTPTLTQYR